MSSAPVVHENTYNLLYLLSTCTAHQLIFRHSVPDNRLLPTVQYQLVVGQLYDRAAIQRYSTILIGFDFPITFLIMIAHIQRKRQQFLLLAPTCQMTRPSFETTENVTTSVRCTIISYFILFYTTLNSVVWLLGYNLNCQC